MRKFLCLLLSFVMVMTMAVPAFADDGTTQSQGENPAPTPTAPVTTPTTPPAPTECSHSWEVTNSKAATCTEAGVTDSRCGKCGATKSESAPATGHSLGGIVHKDESCHKRTCSTCGYEDTTPHTLTETVTTAATCVSAGVSSFRCPCGYSFTKELPVTDHTYTEWSATVETHSRSCTVCQKAESGNHVFTERVEVPATCKEEGVIADYCPTCNYIVYEELPKLTTHTYDNACDPDCNVCGVTREIEHKYQVWYTKNSTGHWYACSICGDKGDFGKHYPGPAATEEKDQICLTCGYVMTPKLNHKHDYAKEWTTDEDGHWYACSGCEDQKDFKAHEYDDACDADCNICGYKTGNAHSFDGTWHSDEDGHWFVCSVCGSVAESKEHIAPADATGEEAVFCTDCGYKIAEATAHVHDFGEEWLKDDLSHWKECECGEKSEITAHIWDEGTEAEDGSVTYVCAECDAQYSEEAPEEETGSFPWWIVLVVLVVLLVSAVVALILVLKPKKKGRFTA